MQTITAMIECPKGINYKLKYDQEKHSFKLNRVLPSGLVFPYDFGMIPGTKGEDGDPLDVIVLSEISGFPGLEMECRIIGVLQCEQTEKNGKTLRNDRYLGVAEKSSVYANIIDIGDLPENMISQLEAFFKNYNEQDGKQFRILNQLDANEAMLVISDKKIKGI
ncbi:inorganic diphosphatase [Mucilaginibacter sp. NFX135]|uniref:inorganic diphosphatase n=1 Tax=Mucilaginibacter sp. NFX135 TaxID=3402687 RepID=UPI003AFB1588